MFVLFVVVSSMVMVDSQAGILQTGRCASRHYSVVVFFEKMVSDRKLSFWFVVPPQQQPSLITGCKDKNSITTHSNVAVSTIMGVNIMK